MAIPTPAQDGAPSAGGRSAWIVAFCCLAAIGEGFDLQLPGVTLPVLGPLLHLSAGLDGSFIGGFFSPRSLFLSMSTFGMLFGAVIGGRASDLVGRKTMMIGSVALFAALSAVTGLSNSAQMLLWVRFFTGLGLGSALPSLIAVVAESVSRSRRNTAVGCLYASMPAGGALASLFSYGLANLAHWPAMYYLGAALPLLAIPGLALGPKSPRREPSGRATAKPAVAEALFGQSRAARTAILWMTFLSALSIQYIMINWLPSLLISKGLLRPQASIVQIGYNLFGAMGSVGVGLLIDRTHRSTATALVFLASIVCLAVLAAAPGVLTICLAIGCLVGCAISATQAIVYALAPSAYPASMRGTGVGFALAAGRIGAAIGPLLAGAVIGAGAGPAQVLGLMVPLLALAGLGAWMINREPSIAA